MDSKFDNLYNKFIGNTTVIEEKDNPDLMTTNALPEPFTEVNFKKDALSNPYLSGKDEGFKAIVAKYIKEAKSPDRKYRLLISSVTSMRNSMEFAGSQSGPLGHIVQIVEQEGPATRRHLTVPLDVLEYKNAAWNANQASIPDGWKYDRFKHKKFSDIIDSYNKGEQPHGTVTKGGNN